MQNEDWRYWRDMCTSRLPRQSDIPQASRPRPDTQRLSTNHPNQGDYTMSKTKRPFCILHSALCIALAVVAASASAGDTSESATIFIRDEIFSFWRTATNSTVTLPIDFPEGTSSATLTVSGAGYHQVYSNLAAGSFDLVLPEATSPDTENVYDLALAFNDGTVRTAKLGLIKGLADNAEGTTRCIVPSSARAWPKAKRRAVLPIPYGTTSFAVSLDGGEAVVTDTGLGGAQGWYVLSPISGDRQFSLSLASPFGDFAATLLGINEGTVFTVH